MPPYSGKKIVAEAIIASVNIYDENIGVLCYPKLKNLIHETIWVYFDHSWEDYFHKLNKGDQIKFKASIEIGNRDAPRFINATLV